MYIEVVDQIFYERYRFLHILSPAGLHNGALSLNVDVGDILGSLILQPLLEVVLLVRNYEAVGVFVLPVHGSADEGFWPVAFYVLLDNSQIHAIGEMGVHRRLQVSATNQFHFVAGQLQVPKVLFLHHGHELVWGSVVCELRNHIFAREGIRAEHEPSRVGVEPVIRHVAIVEHNSVRDPEL